ncbi:unnamed protein product [Psylliodes chrysocephalus]|uniref:Uncharacterized protein n=1 Tax=Psylliodes chrysocephalus TaxID=3402493 RepID=A0A9P0GJB5_9CUCU|nr:unnamed protein product [Psylliodes chrysocephala]
MASELSSSDNEPFQHSSSDFIPDSESSESDEEKPPLNNVDASHVATTSGLVANKKSKKRSSNPKIWMRNQRKLKRVNGEEYTNAKGNPVEEFRVSAVGLIQTRNVQRRRPKGGGGVLRSQTFSYKIKREVFEKRVCKTAFMNIHAITKSRVERIATHMASNIVGPNDM